MIVWALGMTFPWHDNSSCNDTPKLHQIMANAVHEEWAV